MRRYYLFIYCLKGEYSGPQVHITQATPSMQHIFRLPLFFVKKKKMLFFFLQKLEIVSSLGHWSLVDEI